MGRRKHILSGQPGTLPICQKCKSLVWVNTWRKLSLTGFWRLRMSLPWGRLWLNLDYNTCEGPVPCVSGYSAQCGHREAVVPLVCVSSGRGGLGSLGSAVELQASYPSRAQVHPFLPTSKPLFPGRRDLQPWSGAFTCPEVRRQRCFTKTRHHLWDHRAVHGSRGCSLSLTCSWLSSSLSLS